MFSEKIRDFLAFALSRLKLLPPGGFLPLKRSVRDELIDSALYKLDHFTVFTSFTPKEASVMLAAVYAFDGISIDVGDFLSANELDSMLNELERLAAPRNPPDRN